MLTLPQIGYTCFLFLVTVYSVLKERMENGCEHSIINIKKQCFEENSVYLKDTAPLHTDSNMNLIKKIINCMSYHERGAVWRKCVLLSNANIFVVLVILNTPLPLLIIIHIAFLCIIYFFFNYMNFHYYRRLKNNGEDALAILYHRLTNI